LNSHVKPFQLAVDLEAPWIWVKSPLCQSCESDSCESGQCNYTCREDECPFGHYVKTFNCLKEVNGCEVVKKDCALLNEGTSSV